MAISLEVEYDAKDWQAAMQALLLVAELVRAHRHHESVEPPRRARVQY